MKRALSITLTLSTLLALTSCGKDQGANQVVSQRYVHKYGYAVSKDEFEARKYPGQVVSLLKNGVTLTSTYEDGVLHGPSTRTFPHSQTVEFYGLYNQGVLVKEIVYDITGMPMREEVQLSPSRYTTTLWYADGSPMLLEEYSGKELVDGQYLTSKNETEAQVIKGRGERVLRDRSGLLLSKEEILDGYTTKKETFYPSGSPETIAYYLKGVLHGEKKSFTATGEPLSVREYVNGNLHGKSTFFKNGVRYVETYYLDGKKNGLEVQYLDGEAIAQESLWENDHKHGPTKYFMDGTAHLEYFYDGRQISEERWKELSHIDEKISQISPQFQQ